MSIRAVVFDIGGVLEITPDLGVAERWEADFGLAPGTLNERLGDLWSDGALGAISYGDVLAGICAALGVPMAQATAFMDDIWAEYLGTLNAELAAYFGSLRPRLQTAILSNSFVGAREREQAAYGFANLCDFIVYSHEVGIAKPDPRIYQLGCGRAGSGHARYSIHRHCSGDCRN